MLTERGFLICGIFWQEAFCWAEGELFCCGAPEGAEVRNVQLRIRSCCLLYG